MIRAIGTGALAAASVLAAASSAYGQEASSEDGFSIFGWRLSHARVGLGVEPRYLGSKDYRLAPSGSLSFSRPGAKPGRWSAPDDGFSLKLLGDEDLSAGLVGRWRSGRNNDHELRGLDRFGGTVEAGAFANWWPADWLRVRGEARHGIGGHDDWSADLGADAVAATGPWVLSAGPRLTWADNRFTSRYFGITPAEAARSPIGLQPFAAGGSFWSPGALASAEYRVNRFWSLTAVGEYSRLTGDAARSPLVAAIGSKDQYGASLSVTYAFGR